MTMNIDLDQVVDVNPISVDRMGDRITVMTELTLEDGSVVNGKIVFPVDTLEWRAAEYDIDPTDLDTLLDIVLAEPYLGEPDRPDLLLYDAPTIEEARTYHLDRIKKFKDKSKKAKESGTDPLRERAKELSIFHPEAIELKRRMVGNTREKVKKDKEEKAKDNLRTLFVDPDEARIAHLRSNLSSDRTTKKDGENAH